MGQYLIPFLGIFFAVTVTQSMFAPKKFSGNYSGGIHITSFSASTPAPKVSVFSPKSVYVDLTDKIDDLVAGNSRGDIRLFEGCLETGRAPHMFYSTDELLTNIAEISFVADTLDKKDLKGSRLFLSFRFVENGEISPERFVDALNSLTVQIPEKKLESLHNHVSGILLDLGGLNYKPPGYSTKWDISLVKYAKRFAKKFFGLAKFGGDFMVGVKLGEDEVLYKSWEVLQQLKGADVYMFSIQVEVERDLPLTYEKFRYMLTRKTSAIEELLPDGLKSNGTKISFVVNLVPRRVSKFSREAQLAKDEVSVRLLNESETGSLLLLQKFARKWTKEGMSDLVLTTSIVVDEEVASERLAGGYGIVPYFHIQEVDVTACQLKTMLSSSVKKFRSIAVNEFTWAALANFEKEIVSECPKALDFPPDLPSVHLIFTSGIGPLWNSTERYIEQLLIEHQTISGWNLTTLIFPAIDAHLSAPCGPFRCREGPRSDQGMAKFALEMKEMYEIGCLVEFRQDLRDTVKSIEMAYNYNRATTWQCKSIWNESSVIVWHVHIAEFGKDINYEFSFDHLSADMRRILFELLIVKGHFIKEYPEKEVILQISLDDVEEALRRNSGNEAQSVPGCTSGIAILHEFYRGIQAWAEIHGVKVILPPAYYIQNPVRGLWQLPYANGVPSNVNLEECVDPANLVHEKKYRAYF